MVAYCNVQICLRLETALCFVFSAYIDKLHYWFHYQAINDCKIRFFQTQKWHFLKKKIFVFWYINTWFSNHHPAMLSVCSSCTLETPTSDPLWVLAVLPEKSSRHCFDSQSSLLYDEMCLLYPFSLWDIWHSVFNEFRI